MNGQPVARASGARQAVYQVIKDGQVLSEHTSQADARRVAIESGARLRITSQAVPG